MTREVSTRIPAVRPSERLDSTVPPLTSLVRTPLVVRIRIIIPAIIVVLWDRRALDDVGQWTFDSIHRSRDWLRGPTDQNNLGFNNWDSIGNLTRLGWVGQDRAGPSKVYFLFIFQTGAGILKHPLTPPGKWFQKSQASTLVPPPPHILLSSIPLRPLLGSHWVALLDWAVHGSRLVSLIGSFSFCLSPKSIPFRPFFFHAHIPLLPKIVIPTGNGYHERSGIAQKCVSIQVPSVPEVPVEYSLKVK